MLHMVICCGTLVFCSMVVGNHRSVVYCITTSTVYVMMLDSIKQSWSHCHFSDLIQSHVGTVWRLLKGAAKRRRTRM